jgi:flagellar basal body-associated protein FliL
MVMDNNQPQPNINTPPAALDQPQQPVTPVVASTPTKKKLSKSTIIISSIIMVLLVGAVTIMILKQTNINAPVATSQPVKTTKQTASLTPLTSNPKAIDNSSLQTDLTSADNSNSLDSNNLSSTDTNLNDQQQQIAVPTN